MNSVNGDFSAKQTEFFFENFEEKIGEAQEEMNSLFHADEEADYESSDTFNSVGKMNQDDETDSTPQAVRNQKDAEARAMSEKEAKENAMNKIDDIVSDANLPSEIADTLKSLLNVGTLGEQRALNAQLDSLVNENNLTDDQKAAITEAKNFISDVKYDEAMSDLERELSNPYLPDNVRSTIEAEITSLQQQHEAETLTNQISENQENADYESTISNLEQMLSNPNLPFNEAVAIKAQIASLEYQQEAETIAAQDPNNTSDIEYATKMSDIYSQLADPNLPANVRDALNAQASSLQHNHNAEVLAEISPDDKANIEYESQLSDLYKMLANPNLPDNQKIAVDSQIRSLQHQHEAETLAAENSEDTESIEYESAMADLYSKLANPNLSDNEKNSILSQIHSVEHQHNAAVLSETSPEDTAAIEYETTMSDLFRMLSNPTLPDTQRNAIEQQIMSLQKQHRV